ncbi:MAG: hypothetical protein U0790_07160 [Isosphaeraceae bacterium]
MLSETEVARDIDWICRLRHDASLTGHAALAQYCLMLLNTNAFLYLD